TLELEPALQLAFGQLPGAQELLTQPPERPPLRHTHYLTLIEVDLRLVVADLRPHSQDPRLPGQIQELEHILDSQLPQRTLDRHRYLSTADSSASSAATPCRAPSCPGSRRSTRLNANSASSLRPASSRTSPSWQRISRWYGSRVRRSTWTS